MPPESSLRVVVTMSSLLIAIMTRPLRGIYPSDEVGSKSILSAWSCNRTNAPNGKFLSFIHFLFAAAKSRHLDPQNMRTLSTVAQTVNDAPHSATATTLSPMPPLTTTNPGPAECAKR